MNDADRTLLGNVLGRVERLEIKGVSIDSRKIKEGELFVAIKGDQFDGHDFVPDAIKNGAWGALVERSTLENKFSSLGHLKNILAVEDTLYSLQEMSHMHRRKFTIPLVGITGSNGKTTTKEMLAAILHQKGPVLKTEGNLNNHIGVPLTLLKLEPHHTAAAVEMGMSAAGEIDMLARLASPTIGVITNIGPAHLEFFQNMDGIADAKGELLDNLQAGGTAVLNADDVFFGALKKKYTGKVLSFGIDREADVRATEVRQGKDHTDLTMNVDKTAMHVRLRTVGRHNVYNALAAAGAALAAGMSVDAVKTGLDGFEPMAMRSELRQVQGRTVFADFYNANPASMEAALITLMTLAPGHQAVAVLGDMLELGASSADAHREIGRLASRLGVDLLITVGQLAKHIADGAVDSGMPSERVHETRSHADATGLLRKHTRPGDAVLIKGSRGMKMEKILEGF